MNGRATKRRKLSDVQENGSTSPAVLKPHGLQRTEHNPLSNGVGNLQEDTYDEIPSTSVSSSDELASDFDTTSDSEHDVQEFKHDKAKEVTDGVSKPSGPGQRQQTAHKKESSSIRDEAAARSSVFKLEVEEMLRQVKRIPGSHTAGVEQLVRRLKDAIELIPERTPSSIIDATQDLAKFYGVRVPFENSASVNASQYKLGYAKPSNINVIGSYALKTTSKMDERVCVDMVVFMPTMLFSEKDCFDHRYFHKRAFYLACLAGGIQQSQDLKLDVTFQFHNGNPLVPIILIQSRNDTTIGSSGAKYDVTIMPVLEDAFFPFKKTYPVRSCVRKSTNSTSTIEIPVTPFYNASLRADCCVTPYLKLLHGCLKNESFRDACILGRTWLNKRGFGSSISKGGFGNFEWAALLALLSQDGGTSEKTVFSNTYDSTQVFRAMMQFLATRDLVRRPMYWRAKADVDSGSSKETPMLFDGERGLNILFKMTSWSYKQIQQEALNTTWSLRSGSRDQFRATFITRLDEPFMKYDLVATISKDSSEKRNTNMVRQVQDHPLNAELYSTLIKGLTDRVDLLTLNEPDQPAWPVNVPLNRTVQQNYTIGMILNPINAPRTVDRGPSAEEKDEAALFRKLWGQKAELRRFKDGSILESVVWEKLDSPASVVEQIITYLIKDKICGANSRNVQFPGNDFANKITTASSLGDLSLYVTPDMEAFKTLEKDIRALDGLPLHVRQISLSSYGTLAPASLQELQSPVSVVLQFEGSTKWPDKLDAVQMTKIAFLLKIGELLQDTLQGVMARVGLENEDRPVFNKAFLDVRYPTGSNFRIRIHHDRELDLIERQLKDDSATPHERAETGLALAEYKRMFVRRPLHVQAMQKLSTRHSAFSSAVKSVKAWFNAHLLGPHFPEELIEIFVAHAFLHPLPWQTPTSATTGFLRTLLYLSSWDWQHEPLTVDFSGAVKAVELQSSVTRFEAWRKIDPHLNRVALFVATDHDPEGTIWTEHKPTKVIAGRMTSLARAACKAVRDQGLDLDMTSLFKSPLTDYDFVLHMSSNFTRAGLQKSLALKKSRFKNLQLDQSEHFDEYEAVEMYLADIKSKYGEAIVFFYDHNGGEVITGIWNPQTARRRWKVYLGYSSAVESKDVADEEMVDAVINKESILAEIARLGGDMISRVQIISK